MTEPVELSGLPRAIFDASLDGMFVIDLEGRYVGVNPAGCRMFGYDREEFLAADVTLLIFPEDREEALARDRDGWADGLTVPRYRLRHRDGSEVWVALTITPMTIDGRQLALGVKRDITETIRTEEALRRSGARYRTFFDASTDAIFIETPDGRILDCNEVACRLYGYSRKELLKMEVADLVPPEVVEGLFRVIAEHEQGVGLFLETLGVKKDGTVFPTEVSTSPITQEGQDQLVTVFVRDITERKRSEEALRVSEDKYRTVVENATEIITIVQDGIIRFVNNRGAEFTGMAVEDIVGRPFIEMIAEEDRELVVQQHRNRLSGEMISPYAFRLNNPEGRLQWIEITGVLVEWEGRPATVNFLTDITERKRLEDQLRHAQRMEAVGRLAGGIAHDFNNLLTAITGYGSILLTRFPEGDSRRREAEEIVRAGDRATELTDQLLVFSQRKVTEPAVVDLNQLVQGVENMLRRLIGENVDLRSELDPELQAIKVDPGQMEQVLMNLVVNARDAMSGSGRITVRTRNVHIDDRQIASGETARPGRFVRLEVTDTGVGMPPEVIEHIFEPFFTTREQGTGLGLSMVYGIVTQNEGWVEVSSRPGQGATFSIFMPRFSAVPTGEKPKSFSLEGLQGKGERILLVEDEDGVRSFATQVLTENGYQVFSASNAGEALQIFTEESGDFYLVFSDQVLPGKTGLELVEALRREQPEIAVLLSSGYTGEKSARKQIEEMGHSFIPKPYGIVDLLRRIRRLLDE